VCSVQLTLRLLLQCCFEVKQASLMMDGLVNFCQHGEAGYTRDGLMEFSEQSPVCIKSHAIFYCRCQQQCINVRGGTVVLW
jgi:uncharacterized Fe-S radical SAM superfamily protein PflX